MAFAAAGAGKLLGLLVLGALGLAFAGKGDSTDARAEALIAPSERNHPKAAAAKFQIGQAIKTGKPATMLALADMIQAAGMPLTAQNVRAYANGMQGTAAGQSAYNAASNAGPASSLPGANVTPPADVINAIAQALASNDPDKFEALATQLDARGYKAQAADLRAAAKQLRDAQNVIVAQGAAAAPAMQTNSGAPSVPAASAAGVIDPKQLLAGKVVIQLNNGNEDKELVKLYQQQEKTAGRYGGAIDGLYGPKTAVTLMYYNFVPPKPLHWPTQGKAQAKEAYRKLIAAKATQDAPRQDEWIEASRV